MSANHHFNPANRLVPYTSTVDSRIANRRLKTPGGLTFCVLSLFTLLPAIAGASAIDSQHLERMATCEASWLDWKDDDVRMEQFMSSFDRDFSAAAEDGSLAAKQPITAFGHPVDKVNPQSVGMGLGFSLQLKGSLQNVRETIEERLGKKMECSTGEGMTSCGVELESRKTVMVMANANPADKTSVVGCFY